ncbi:Translin family protein [Melia azedarach]|uniref:Translin family protein n=1 Tax=Melia azedarach TaxID=155640 RepID=A0ACC1X0A8_MELAZ|nr:Translin family protein [Melia azedarach]
MKTAFRNTVALITLSRSINPHSHFRSLLPHFSVAAVSSSPPLLFSLAKPETFRFRRVFSSQRHSSMTGGEAYAPMSMEKQFEDFRIQLEEAGNLRERIRAVVMEIESTTRLMYASFLLVHQSRPLSEVLEKHKTQVDTLKELYRRLAEILCACPGDYYRYHNDWRSETQTVVSLLAFMHWLETGSLLMHTEAQEKLGLNEEFALDIEDYLIGLCFLSNEMPRYVVNQVLAGNYDCPRKALKFLTDLHAAFRMLNLRNDFLRKKFDSLKYDLKRVEEVYYDMKIRHLADEDSTGDNGNQGQS